MLETIARVNPTSPQRPKRVAHLSSVHGAHDRRIRRECGTLRDAGHDVTLVARTDRGDHDDDGIRIRAVRKPSNRIERVTKTIGDVYRIARELHADVYHFHDPELLPVGLALQRTGANVVYDVHEDVPRQVLEDKDWLPRWMRPAVSSMAAATHRVAQWGLGGIVCAWPNIAEHFNHPRMALVRNFPHADEFALAQSEYRSFRERPNLAIYCGTLMETRSVREMADAMLDPELPADSVLKIAGEYDTPELAAYVAQPKFSGHVESLGWIGSSAYFDLLRSARVGISLCYPTPAYVDTLSTKVFEYLGAGVPVILSDFPRWREVVDEYDCGIAVDPLDTRGIARAIARLMNDPDLAEAMGRRGRRAIEEKYNWENEGRRLVELYDRFPLRTRA